MRPLILAAATAATSALVLALAVAPAAFAQATPAVEQPTPPPSTLTPPVPPNPNTAFSTSTKAADLSGLNVAIAQAEEVMTRIRDAELSRENARLKAIKPALPFHGRTWLPDYFL